MFREAFPGLLGPMSLEFCDIVLALTANLRKQLLLLNDFKSLLSSALKKLLTIQELL